jgi:hypothetical protein
MPMTWLEAIQFVGLDLQIVLLLAVAGLGLAERALHAAWAALGNRTRGAALRNARGTTRRITLGQIRHV